MTRAARIPAGKQRGNLMVALMAGIAIVLILSTVAVQAWSDIARRDAEAEMIFRAEDIVRGLRRFQTDKGRLPIEFKELMEPGQKSQYFLRRLWKDPLVKGGEWQFLYAAPGGGLFDPSAPVTPDTGGLPQTGQAPTGLNANDPGAAPAVGKKSDGSPDTTGLPIAGVKTRCKDRPFRHYRDKTEYSEWVFSIFDLDPRTPGARTPVQPNPQNPQNPQNPPTFPPTTK